MSLWSRFFGSKFDDEMLVSTIHTAILEDPTITDHSKVNVDSKDGVVTLTGSVEKQMEKDHVEGTARDALRYHGQKFERIVNDIKVTAETVTA